MIKEFLCERGNYRDDKTFSKLTTVKMGGEIAHYVEPYNLACLKEIIDFVKAEHIPFKVIGNGSNLICGSSRFEGVVISLKNFNNFEVYNDQSHALSVFYQVQDLHINRGDCIHLQEILLQQEKQHGQICYCFLQQMYQKYILDLS